MEHLLAQWRSAVLQREAMPSWRGLVADPIWSQFPAVLLVDKLARRNSYEVYVEGRQISREWRLDDAKTKAEKELGPLIWARASLEQINALHYYFGWTREFTDPVIAYLGRPTMPRLAATTDPRLLAKIEDWRWRLESVDQRVAKIQANIERAKASGLWAEVEAQEAAGTNADWMSTFRANQHLDDAMSRQQVMHEAAAAWFSSKDLDPDDYDLDL